MNKINVYKFIEPTILSIFVTIIASVGAFLFLYCPFSECTQVMAIYRWFLGGILFFWLDRIYTNTWVFDMTCLKSQPKQMAALVLIPYVQLFLPTASLVNVWQCADKDVGEREWKKAKRGILHYILSVSIIVTAIFYYLNTKYLDFFNKYIYFDSNFLADHFIPWCISGCILLGIIDVWQFNRRQIEKYEHLKTIKNRGDDLSIALSDEQIKELAKVSPIPVEEPIPGITNAKKNLKGSFSGMTITIWIHVITLILIAASLVLNNQPTSQGEGSIFIYMLLLQLLFFSIIWIYTTHSVNNAFDILEKPIRPLNTFVCLLIPGVNLIYPSLKMMQIWKVSHIDSTRENWKKAAPSFMLILNWVFLFIFSWQLIQATGKNFMLSNDEDILMSGNIILLLVSIIAFMFQLRARQKAKAIKLNMLPDQDRQHVSTKSNEPSFFQNLD